jgi:hypothetical protein
MVRSSKIYIGLGGRAGHGKTTLARDLQNYFRCAGMTCDITSFATIPKKMLATMGLSNDELYGADKEKPSALISGHTPRFAMQSLATEWGRHMLYDEIWVDAWQRDAQARRVDVVIVDDIRHGPEIDRLQEMGAKIYEVYRPSKMPQSAWGWCKHYWHQLSAHSSERLNFRKHGIQRIIVCEGESDKTLYEALEIIFEVQ